MVEEIGWASEPVWIGPQKSRPTMFETLDIQPIESRYNDFAIPATSVQV